MERITVRVPATSANLGPGFDTLGLALASYNVVTATPAAETTVTIKGEGAGRLATDSRNLVYRALVAGFQARGAEPPAMALHCENVIPVARGLGSSSSAIAAGLVLANEYLDHALSSDDLVRIGTRLEGHPDNVVPCLLGGVRVSVMHEGEVITCPISAPHALHAVAFVPDIPMRTQEARAALPKSVPFKTAVFNVSRAALLVAALSQNRLDLLGAATEDMLHQPPRSRIFPAFPSIIQAARAAGAHGAFLSGAGSSVLALVTSNADTIGKAMLRAAEAHGVYGYSTSIQLDHDGAMVLTT